ncbi:MAG: phosphotransferase [Woeseiaceae bacterium]|nr:phosphotransferase [Woeseiaceae bacterium]NIP20551.1 phosphotransferase [Woeseiaceae bacterium]NIS89344.1 phosphotransferase [Woeseiaceae bacterium]
MRDTFRKTGPESALDRFEAEAQGLNELRAAGEIRVPEVIDVGAMNGQAYIDLERLDFEPSKRKVETALGEKLAALHRHTQPEYGWFRDNTIGLTPQHNERSDNWIAFFRQHRLGFQVDLAVRNGFGAEVGELGEQLAKRLPELFDGYTPVASLLHGDLWGGNWGSVGGEPVIFDPAVYYGDRESDIAMTMLFGGFGRAFYDAYASSWPMESGHENRLKLYRLYHVLNHLNLFGRSYLAQAVSLLRELT